eukprot:6001474-Pyramimonas_sp.AAC.1
MSETLGLRRQVLEVKMAIRHQLLHCTCKSARVSARASKDERALYRNASFHVGASSECESGTR